MVFARQEKRAQQGPGSPLEKGHQATDSWKESPGSGRQKSVTGREMVVTQPNSIFGLRRLKLALADITVMADWA